MKYKILKVSKVYLLGISNYYMMNEFCNKAIISAKQIVNGMGNAFLFI